MEDNLRKLIEIAQEKLGIRFMKQLFAVLLLIFGVDKKTIIAKLGIARLSIKKYEELIQSGRIQDIFCDNGYRPRSEMEDYKDEIAAALEKEPPHTLRETAAIIKKVSGLERSLPQVMKFLKRTGIKR